MVKRFGRLLVMTQTGIDLEELRRYSNELWNSGAFERAKLIHDTVAEIEFLRLQVESRSNDYWSK